MTAKKMISLFMILVTLVFSILLTGCSAPSSGGGADSQPVAVAILICNGANRAVPDLESPKLQEAVAQAAFLFYHLKL